MPLCEPTHGQCARWAVLAPGGALSSRTPTSRCRSATAGRRVRARQSPPAASRAVTGIRVVLRERGHVNNSSQPRAQYFLKVYELGRGPLGVSPIPWTSPTPRGGPYRYRITERDWTTAVLLGARRCGSALRHWQPVWM